MQKTTCAIFILLVGMVQLHAQGTDTTSLASRQYATQNRLRQILATYPAAQDDMAAIERYTTDFRYFGLIDTMSVALVFHLMPLPAGATAISQADIQAQLNRLTLDFLAPEHPYLGQSYQHPELIVDASGEITGTEADQQTYLSLADKQDDFASHAANPLVHFCLPALDPSGQPTNGQVAVYGTPQTWSMDETLFQSNLGGSDPWNPTLYCNIWVARLSGDMAGFAQLPGGPSTTDGVVIDDRYFARALANTPFASGKTLTHLLGSYLNLYELWNAFTPCADDYVDDTPIHNASNFGLPDYPYRHISTCAGNPAEMLSNLMDNSIDSIQYLFTWGQVIRMQATLAQGGPRNRLRSTATACGSGHLQNPGGESTDRESPSGDQNAGSVVRLRVFPNPSAGQFTVEVESAGAAEEAELYVMDALGTTIYRQPSVLQPGTNRFAISAAKNWNSGVYVVTIVTRHRTLSEKILLNR